MTMAFEPYASYNYALQKRFSLERVSKGLLGRLREILGPSKSLDAYVRSPLYFAMTGRNGLYYIYSQSWNVGLLACPHPNDVSTLLLFIPFIYDTHSLRRCATAITIDLKSGAKSSLWGLFSRFDNVHIARVPKYLISQSDLERGRILKGCHIQREDKLDWIYPSYDILLRKSANPTGSNLSAYRNKVNKYKNQGVTPVPFGNVPMEERATAMRSIAKRWAENRLKCERDGGDLAFLENELLEPYEYLADLTQNPVFSVDGIFLKRGSEYIAFRLWEDNGDYDRTVPSFAALMASYEPGCSEYLHYEAARRLLARGYQKMCIGGSESAGLDSFKQKFQPIGRHELFTVKLDIYVIANLYPMNGEYSDGSSWWRPEPAARHSACASVP
jgi:hypothetical protein